MRKFLSLMVAVFMAAMTFGQSYGILVNGTTYYAGSAVGEYEGFTQYLAHVPLQAGDYCQLYDADNEAAWAVTLNTYSAAGFTLSGDRYDVSVSGCYDFYIKLKYGADELYIGTGSDCGEGVNINEEDLTVVYDWAGNVGTTILGAGGKVTVSTTKIHTNQDVVNAVKFEKSFLYAEGHYMAIKPAEGTFKAGDSITFSAVFNNANADGTKFVQVDFYAADGATRLFRGDSVVNGQKDAADPNVEGFKLAADQDSIFIGRYGNTNMFLTLLKVTRAAETPEPPVEDPAKFYVTGDSALVTDAGFPGKAWNPAAIKSEADTLALNLKAAQAYKLKVTLDGQWATVKGYEDLSEKPAGVSADNDGNIIFTLAEAGAVKVIYTAELFKVEGNFYVEPAGNPAKFYVTGDSALLADAAGDAELAWNPAAIKSEADTLALNLKAAQAYKLKVTLDGQWATAKGYEDLSEKPAGVSADNDGNIIFTLAEAGAVKVIYKAGEEPLFKIEGNFYVAPDQPEGLHGYYLVGSFNNWVISAAYKFVSNEEANYDEKILRDVTLAVGDELKVVTINDAGDVIRYYPEGVDNNYVVDAAHAGVVTVYFTPWANPDWESFHEGGWFYIPSNTGTGIDETADGVKAVKVLRNGQLLIIKGENTYNAQGSIVK